jgi:hypothetical protein
MASSSRDVKKNYQMSLINGILEANKPKEIRTRLLDSTRINEEERLRKDFRNFIEEIDYLHEEVDNLKMQIEVLSESYQGLINENDG